MKPTKGLRENINDLKYSLASLIKIVDEDGKKINIWTKTNKTLEWREQVAG